MLDDPNPRLRAGPPRATVVREAAAFTLPAGTERYIVPGGGAVLIAMSEGDRIELTDEEGGQPCEIVPVGPHAAEMIGSLEAPAAGLRAVLGASDQSLRSVRLGLEARGVDLAAARARRLFGAGSPAGASEELRALADGAFVVCAPGGPMSPHAQETATPIRVVVRRATIARAPGFDLPEPLADPEADIRVHSATAEAYFVKAGDYIQILDVDGRQCTDFQCFDARKLDKGDQKPLDVTTTRTLIGHSYPMPGLHAKYYDQDMTPLVEVVQDTCGRHDAFAMACAAKYYDDIGYPGHVNCTDNFNGALADRGVDPRAGWMAINFFFNTGIDENGVLYTDAPWSRPGDYVMLRALTDLVCVSSACPDDTTAANGWNPTDIHVRTYDGRETFERAIAYRPTPDSEPRMTKKTGFHDRFAQHTRNFVEYKGYWLAGCFADAGPVAEYWACRQKAVIMDLSPLRKFEVTGPDAEALLQWCLTRNVRKLPVGGVVYTAMCYPHGGMIDDGTLFRLGPDQFRWIGGDDYSGEWLREQAAELGLQVSVRSSTDQMHNVAVQGPESRDVLKKIVWTAPHQPVFEEMGWFRFAPARIGGERGIPIVVSRTGYTGELGYEVFCHPKDAGEVFDAIWEAGKGHGLTCMGLEALDLVRIEAGLIFAGYDFSDQTDPFEAGIGFTVPLKSKEDDFVGREALVRRKGTPARVFVGLDVDGAGEIGHGDCVRIGRAQVGEICSAMRSPASGKTIALARLDVAHADAGAEVEVGRLDGHQRRYPATVRETVAAYDPGKERPRS